MERGQPGPREGVFLFQAPAQPQPLPWRISARQTFVRPLGGGGGGSAGGLGLISGLCLC